MLAHRCPHPEAMRRLSAILPPRACLDTSPAAHEVRLAHGFES
jgi:hypothetical protein